MDINPGILQHEDTSQSMHDVNSNSYLLKKICHWGPLSTIGIISIITLTTLDCEGQYEGIPSFTAFFMFTFFSAFTIIHFITAIIEGPGFLPLRWMPEEATNKQYLQFCTVCQGYKAPRSHHCRKCGRCVMKMDHHCPWINTCVGHYNHRYFTAFLATAVAGCWLSTYILTSWIKVVLTQSSKLPFPPPTVFRLILVVFSIGLSIGVVFAVGVLLYIQILTIVRNRTEIEDWILEKARYRRKDTDDKYVHPYSKGWHFNIKQVFWNFGYPASDGITWPVIDGCDQYTLTREQLAQKQDKRNRARRYRIIKNASGSRFPIGHGFGVFFHPPCTDEPRIKLDVGDIVVVTRWKKYWLFGEKEQKGGDVGSKRVRGWLPRPCTIEVIESDLHGSDLYSLSKNKDN